MDWRTRLIFLAAAQTILAAGSISKSTGVAYTTFFNALQRKRSMLLKSGERGNRKPVHLAQFIDDQTPHLNVHGQIRHNGEVSHHVDATYGV